MNQRNAKFLRKVSGNYYKLAKNYFRKDPEFRKTIFKMRMTEKNKCA